MAEVITNCDCGQLPPLPRNQQLDAYDRKQWGATLSDADLDAMRARFVAAELEPIAQGCEACGAEAGEECRPMCIGQAAELDAAGIDLTEPEAHEFSAEPDDIYPHLVRGHCSCGWHSSGYSRIARVFFDRHVAETGSA